MYSGNMPEPEAELSYDTVNHSKSSAGTGQLKQFVFTVVTVVLSIRFPPYLCCV